MYHQQGDVLLKKVASLPKKSYKKSSAKRIILAEGEQTGHNHTLISELLPFIVYKNEKSKNEFIEIISPSNIVHQEHHKLNEDISPGIYKIEIINEYDHFEEEKRLAID